MRITKALEDSILQAKEIGNSAIEAVIDEKDSQTLVMIMKAMIEREF
jgi:octaprenyl-diphosphate synthase